jgi:hypothetical protein
MSPNSRAFLARTNNCQWIARSKNCREVLREAKPMRFALLHIERAHFPISALWRVLEVTRSGAGD